MKGKKLNNGSITVDFVTPDWYYAHDIREVGSPNDAPGTHSMWAWINHLRDKNWWTLAMEQEFQKEVLSLL